jgi:hypothetical protein
MKREYKLNYFHYQGEFNNLLLNFQTKHHKTQLPLTTGYHYFEKVLVTEEQILRINLTVLT